MHTLSYYIAELLLISLHCWGISWLMTLLRYCQSYNTAAVYRLFTFLRCSHSLNNADVYPFLLHCCAFTNLKTWLTNTLSQNFVEKFTNVKRLLMYTLSHYIAQMFPILKHCWRIPCYIILLSCFSFYKLLSRILSSYIAELFPVLKHCWCIPCRFTLLRSFQSRNIADVDLVLIHGWAIPYLSSLSNYGVS